MFSALKHTSTAAVAAAVAMHHTRTLWDLSAAFGILSLTTISIALHHAFIVFLFVAIKAIEPFVGAIPSIQPIHTQNQFWTMIFVL
jgi:hypothetical protein